jgi:benzoate-CoA ligase family protein
MADLTDWSCDIPERFNAALILDQNLAVGRENKTAVLCEGEDVSYGQLVERTQRFAAGLLALGVRPEQRVLLVLDDTPHWPTAFLGAMRMGAVPVPVSPLDSTANFAHYLRDSGAAAVVIEASAWPNAEPALRECEAAIPILIANGEVGGYPTVKSTLATHDPLPEIYDTHRDDAAFWLYSSGSTGRPKGVVHLHHDIPVTCETYGRHILDIREDDITFSTTKLYHAYGMGNNLSFPYSVGATTVLRPERPKAEPLLEVACRFKPTLLFSVPTLYNAMLAVPGRERFDLSSVRMCLSAAEPLAPEVLRAWRDAFGLDILDGIGSTEMLHVYCSNRSGHVRPGTSGRPVPGYELRLRDDDGVEVPQGAVGNLLVRGDSALAYYWRQHERTKRVLQGEWFFTGDRYRQDDHGNYVYEGRADDMIKIGGLWASPVEIENALIEHPTVYEAAAIGVRIDATTRIKAFVVLSGESGDSAQLERELREWCKTRLRRYEYPHFFEFVDALPKTLTGKIERYKLRAAD